MNNVIKIKKENLGDQVSELLKGFILEEKWKIGEKIPSENDLSNIFGVSRLTVRLAIQKLVSLGILETRVGEGTFVKEFDFSWYVNEISDIMVKPEMLDDVQEFRRLIEIECGRLAINNATEKQLEELEEYSRRFDEFSTDPEKDLACNITRFVNIDYNFHYKLCQLSNNSLFILAYATAKEPIIRYLKTIIKSRWESYLQKNHKNLSEPIKFPSSSHHELVIAIKEKNFDKFKAVYYDMVNYKHTDYYKIDCK